jgi:catechol 2,3-dioxygenase-like lactoylglutathione lyase family enzyme
MSHPPISHQITFLYTRDLARAAHFYTAILGLPLALDQGTCRIYRTGPGSYLGVCQRAEVAHEHPDVIFTLVTPDVDAWYTILRARGVMFEKAPAVNPKYRIYHCFLRDPDGYLIEIQKFLDPRWPEPGR